MRLYIARFKSTEQTLFGEWLLRDPEQFDQVIEAIRESYDLLIEPLSQLASESLERGETVLVATSDDAFHIVVFPVDIDDTIVAI